MPHSQRQFAKRAFHWVICAFQPLKTKELAVVILIDPNTEKPDVKVLVTEETSTHSVAISSNLKETWILGILPFISARILENFTQFSNLIPLW